MRQIVFLCVLAVLAPSRALAQQPAEAIPKELVKLLLSGGFSGNTFDIVLGLPPAFPQELLPRDATAAIATVSPASMMVIAEAPDLPVELPRYERQLANAGWAPPAAMYSTMGRGLLSAPSPRAPTMLCNGDRHATYTLSPRPAGGSFVRISFVTPQRSGPPCGRPATSTSGGSMSMGIYGEVDIPALLPPPGSRAATGPASNSSSVDYTEQRLRLQSSLPVSEVLQHYRTQIETHGWKFESQAAADGIAVMRFSLTSIRKEPVVAIVSVTQVPGPAPIEVSLYLTRASSR